MIPNGPACQTPRLDSCRGTVTSRGQAFRYHAGPRIQPGQPHRRLAHRAPVYLACLPPCNDACPAGENIQQWLYDAEEGGLPATRPRGGRSWPTTRSRPSWAGSATGPARPPATGRRLDTAVGINSVERYLGDQAIRQGWPVPR